jgi:annexin A7/11
MTALCTDPADWDAQLVRKAVGGLGTDESLLSEVLCTRTPGELKAAAASYQKLFNRNMEADIKSDVSGDLGLVYACVFSPARGTRSGNVEADAEALFKAGAGKLGTDENSFINIIASSSREHAEALFYEYAKKHGKALDVVIRDEMSGDAGKALAQLATPPHVLFADKIRGCMQGMGTNDEKLIRLLTTQRGRNLKAAGKHFLEVHRQTISAAVTSETSGDYRAILLKMLAAEGV